MVKKPAVSKKLRQGRFWVVAAALLVLLIAVSAYVRSASITADSMFTGTVTAVDRSCMSDGICKLVVNGKTVITGCGMVLDDKNCPRDSNAYQNFSEGDRVKVNANRNADGSYNLHCDGCGITRQ